MTVQVTAGNRLFNVVVDNDDTASRIVALLNRDKYAAAWPDFTSWMKPLSNHCIVALLRRDKHAAACPKLSLQL